MFENTENLTKTIGTKVLESRSGYFLIAQATVRMYSGRGIPVEIRKQSKKLLAMRRHLILALCAASLAPIPALADVFTFSGSGQTGSVQQFTAPVTGEYDIVAFGSSGGGTFGGRSGGLGAEIGGDFNLTAGEILDIYLGGTGQQMGYSGGGGGGSFVVVHTGNAPLVIAGGGGGAGFFGDGKAGQTSVVNIGEGGAGVDGGGGGGFNSPANGGDFDGGGGQGFSTLTGGIGDPTFGGYGGYGGGAGGGIIGGGGGGGYGGGDGGSLSAGNGGGGGGSFLDPSVMDALTMAGENTGNGMVTINQVPAPVPEPGTLSLLALTLLCIAGLRRLGRRRTAAGSSR